MLVNIDTVELEINSDHSFLFDIPTAQTVRVISPEGELISTRQNRREIGGVHKLHELKVRALKSGKQLFIEGPLFAFRYGQNAFTSSNLKRHCRFALRRVINHFGLTPPQALIDQWLAGQMDLKRIDLAVNFRLESQSEIEEALIQIRRQLVEHGASVLTRGTTTIWQPQGGREYSISFYAKGPQLEQLKRIRDFPWRDELIKECSTMLRVELRLRKEALLKHGFVNVSEWTMETPEYLFRHYFSKLPTLTITSSSFDIRKLEEVPSNLRRVLELHLRGGDIKASYNPHTLRRHLAAFRKMGLDLRIKHMPEVRNIPLNELLSWDKAISTIPLWLKTEGLAPSKKRSPLNK